MNQNLADTVACDAQDRPGIKLAGQLANDTLTEQLLGSRGQVGAKIRMRDRDQFIGSLALRFPLKRRDPVFSHHVMYESAG
jgi:hypothetical protein